jgi:hypothetical protein
MNDGGPSWTSSAPHRWPKKGERKLAHPIEEETHPRPKRIEECKPGDLVWWDLDGETEQGVIVSFEEEFVYCRARNGKGCYVPYDALATTENGLRKLRAKREMARSTGGF